MNGSSVFMRVRKREKDDGRERERHSYAVYVVSKSVSMLMEDKERYTTSISQLYAFDITVIRYL